MELFNQTEVPPVLDAAITIAMEIADSTTNGFSCTDDRFKKTSGKRKNVPGMPKLSRKPKRRELVFSADLEMPTPMRDRIAEFGGYEIQLVLQKQLHDSDLNKNHGRLSIPVKKLKLDFATEEEKEWLKKEDDSKNKRGVNVPIIDTLLRESVICLKKWKVGSQEIYCLVSQWNSFVQQNSLESGDVIQLWSFRKDGFNAATETETLHHLCFAMVKLDVTEGIFKFI